MTAAPVPSRDLALFRLLFLAAAAWNLAGGLPGTLYPAGMFLREFGLLLTDPVLVSVYRGAWGTSLLYAFGYALVAIDPVRHTGVVLVGGIGKAGFALNLLLLLLAGRASGFAWIVVLGDATFIALFLAYLLRLKRLAQPILWTRRPND